MLNGGNDINYVDVADSAEVEMSFTGENEVSEILARDEADVTVNADGHNEFEEVIAAGNADVTINVTGENNFEEITGYGNANITITGTDCQKTDVVNLGDGEKDASISTDKGTLEIDHVTVNLQGTDSYIGSDNGNVRIDTSKVALDDGGQIADIHAGGKMEVRESVIEVAGTVSSIGEMTIDHSDVKVDEPDGKFGPVIPYRVYSETGINLINEENGDVVEGEINGKKVYYVDTGDGNKVDLRADGEPGYYKCKGAAAAASAMPKTADPVSPFALAFVALASAAAAAFAARRCREMR